MVIISFPFVVNMPFISKFCMLSSAILWLQLSTAYSHNQWKSATFLSPKFELGPGYVARKEYFDIAFPKGHIAIKSLEAELVDEAGHPLPLYEAYLDHWSVIRYNKHKYKSNVTEGGRVSQQPSIIFSRNSGPCKEEILPQFWGLGSETRGTSTKIPDPFGIEAGNPENIPYPYEEQWLLNVMVIDMRGVEDGVGCLDCRCDLYSVTKDLYGQPLKPNYKGGSLCCYDNTQCRVKHGFQGPRRSLYLRYTVRWVDWNQFQVPVKVYILDVTDNVETSKDLKVTSAIHNCQVEYDIQAKVGGSCPDVKKGLIPMERGGYVVYAVAHQHSGGVGSTLYGQDGRILCTSTPKYGTGKEVGNEEGYIVGMSTCYPQPGSVMINNGEILTLQSNYNSSISHTGVVGQFYILVAEQLPH